MATNTTNYGFKKPDESDFYDVADQNKNWDLADEALKNLDTPTFEDYTGSTAVPSATDAIDQIKSKGKLGTLLSNIKAAFKGACLIGHIVNNCVTDNSSLPLSAAQGKVLKDLYTQLYSEVGTVSDNLSQKFAAKDISNGSLDQITTTGFYFGSNITEVTPYIKSHKWCLINAFVSGNSANIFVVAGDAMALSIYRNGDGVYSYYPIATKSDLASVDITPAPISGLALAPATMFKKAGVAYLNLQISNTTSAAIPMENGKVIATGFPIPYKKQQVYVEAIPWNNEATGSNPSTTPLRLCINNIGQLCSYYPSANEKITPGMPICINMAYPINK